MTSSLGIAFCALAVAQEAQAAEPETAVLIYERPSELSTCPDEAAFRQAVSARLGRDPFASDAARKIHVLITRNGAKLSAVVRVEEAGVARGERRIDTHSGCEELASGAALAVSIAIDPLAALGPPPADTVNQSEPNTASGAQPKPKSEPASARKPPPASAKPVTPPSPETNDEPTEPRVAHGGLFAHAGMWGALGVVPGFSAGANAGIGYRAGSVSFALDALGILPQHQDEAGSARSVSVDVLGAQLSPCLHFEEFRACAKLGSGALIAHGEGVDNPRTGTTWTAWAGLGAGYSFYSEHFSITPTASLSMRLVTTELGLNDQTIWTTPLLFGTLGLELGYDFWR